MSRPSVAAVLLDVATAISARSTCTRAQVGAVVADARGVILSSGYNGSPAGLPHCDHTVSDGPCVMSLHAEANAIIWAARRGVALEGQWMVCTHEPCYDCAKIIIQTGIGMVYYHHAYPRNSGSALLESAGIEVFPLR